MAWKHRGATAARCCLLSEPALERKAVGKAPPPTPLHSHLPHGYEGQRHKILLGAKDTTVVCRIVHCLLISVHKWQFTGYG